LRPSRKKNRLDKVIVNSLIFSAVVVALNGPIREFFVFTLNTINSFNHSVSENTSQQIEKFSNSTELIQSQRQEIERLKKELNRASYENNLLLSQVNNVDSLNNLLALSKTRFPKAIAAKVAARSPSSWHQELIIDKGSNNQIRLGMVVVTDKGVVGQVQEVKKNYALVQSIASSQVRFGAMIQRTKVMGILFGEKPGYAQLKFIPIGSDIHKGDLIQTTEISSNGIERLFPYAYPIGKVVELMRDKNNSEMYVRVKLFEDGSTISNVLVLADAGLKPKFQPVDEKLIAKDNPPPIVPVQAPATNPTTATPLPTALPRPLPPPSANVPRRPAPTVVKPPATTLKPVRVESSSPPPPPPTTTTLPPQEKPQ